MTTPRATYRLQLTPELGFDGAAGLADYLAELGVSHLYTSPILQPQPGSTHGYDVIDHLRVNQELGGRAGLDELTAALRSHGLSLVVDIVPNHMAVATPGNRWWMDVLQNGRSSRYAPYFDIDWEPPESKLAHKILVPVLGDHYGRVLEAGELTVVRHGGNFEVAYYEHRFPLSPRTLADLVERVAVTVGSEPLEFLARSLRRLPSSRQSTPAAVEERQVDGPVLQRMLGVWLADEPVAAVVDAEVARLNADPDALDALLAEQNYRLAYWRTSGRELDYRRFFDVDNLVGVRVEDPHVFDEVHRRVEEWVGAGTVDGIRVDHVDGLRDPRAYLERLRTRLPGTYLVVEKILESDEELPTSWPVDGTTGYEFAALATGLLVDPDGEKPLTELYDDVVGEDRSFATVLRQAKHDVMRDVLGSELNRLTEAFVGVCEDLRRFRDFSRHELHETVREVLADFEVYRTYVTDAAESTPADRARVERAVAEARDARPDLDPELFTLLRAVLVGDSETNGPRERELRARFQQVSGAVMAKSEEDTSFYRYPRLLALNEVGADPGRFGVAPSAFHAACARTQERWPTTMLALTTHDTKRSEDVRARLAVLSEVPEAWAETVGRWRVRNHRHHRAAAPDATTEYYLYQALVGAHPLPLPRAWTHLEKAVREAKVHTSWVNVDDDYERDLRAFVDALYADDEFQAELEAFVGTIRRPGRVNALAQKLLQLTAPGVPDLYQGQELWDLSLVDPDNRRPVDFDLRRRLLARGREPDAPDEGAAGDGLDEADDPGLAKLRVVERALALRRARPHCFDHRSSYRPLLPEPGTDERSADGAVVAFTRHEEVVVVVPRLTTRHDPRRSTTPVALPEGSWTDWLTTGGHWSGRVPVGELLSRFPVALLVRDDGRGDDPSGG